MSTERIVTEYVYDDVDMAADTKTVADVKRTFSYENSGTLVLDLTTEHAKQLDDLLATWVAIASPATRTRTNRAPAGEGSDRNIPGRDRTPQELKEFRAWAADNDQPVHRYDGGGYRYDADQLAAWDASREVKTDDKSKTDDK